ncbi:protein kinase domain-containing protein [Streptomyces humicola]|uniref:protein kinase domain-containing protein n=1 Tax=Streptomyces humicola TaxID=2953240 RepID=UPI003557D3FE
MARKIGSRYTAHQILGRGSAGTVWLGEGPEGPVAIKLLREDLASDQDLVGRFVQERTALLSLDDPHIVGIRDLVVDGTDLALVMDLVRGSDLRSRLERDRRLAPEAAVSIAADVADGLAAAHAAGVVHRDVKPENVLLDAAAPPGPGGAPPAMLTDFGIARLVDSPRRTRATRIIGTPDYLAPEIIEGLPPRASVDIYALATVLYELLTGFTPFGGGHPGAVLRRHVTETVTPVPGIPDALWQILAQCLAKAPASRLTAGELAERLRRRLPELAGLPPLEVAAPHDGDGRTGAGETDAEETAEPAPSAPRTRRGAVPLVRASAPDSSRETHTSIKLPTADELAGYPRREGGTHRPTMAGGGARARHRAVSDSVRRRRIKLAAAAAAALVAAGIGGWALASGGDDAKANTREDHQPGDSTATSPGADASPQGSTGTPVALPRWSAFQDAPRPGVPLTGGPRAIALSGTTYVFARGADQNVWYITRDERSGRYGAWQRLTGIHVTDDPAVVSAQQGQLDLFALGTDGLLYRRTMSAAGSGWGAWYQVDERTHFDAAPAAASSAPGRIDLVGLTGGQLVTASFVGGRWNVWAALPAAGRVAVAPGLVSRAPGTLDAFVVRKADGAVVRLPYTGGAWQPPQVVGHFDAAGRPEAGSSGEPGGQTYVFAPEEGGGLAEATGLADGDWEMTQVQAPSAGGSAAGVLAADGHVELWVRTGTGGLAVAVG